VLGWGARTQAERAPQLGGAGDGQALEYGGAPETERRYEGAFYIGSWGDPELGCAPRGVDEWRLPGFFDYGVEPRPGKPGGHEEYPAPAGDHPFDLERFLDLKEVVAVTHGWVQIVEEGFRTPEGQDLGALEHVPLQKDAQPRPVGATAISW
jgi:hypothetical protein